MDEKTHISWNEQMAAKYDIDRFHDRSNALVKYIEKRRVISVVSMLSPRKGEKILEVGCGSGRILSNVKAGRLYGIDISKRFIKKARDRLGTRATIVFGNAEKIPFAEDFFDKVYCTEVLEHLQNPSKAIDEIRRVAKKDGIAIISVPNEGMIIKAKALVRKIGLHRIMKNVADEQNEWHIHDFDMKMLLSLTKGKMKLVKTNAIPSKLVPLHYVASFRVLK